MEENKVENVINIIKGMYIKDKLRLGICLTTSDWANILYNKTEIYEKFDTMASRSAIHSLNFLGDLVRYTTTTVHLSRFLFVNSRSSRVFKQKSATS